MAELHRNVFKPVIQCLLLSDRVPHSKPIFNYVQSPIKTNPKSLT